MRLGQVDDGISEEGAGVHREPDVDAVRALGIAVRVRDRHGDALGVCHALLLGTRGVEVRRRAGHRREVRRSLLIASLREDAAAIEHQPDHADDGEDAQEEQDHDLAPLASLGGAVVHRMLLAHG